MGEQIIPAANERAVGFFDAQPIKLWDHWRLSGGRYQAPEPQRFEQVMREVAKHDRTAKIRGVVDYSLERSGLILSPAQLSEPLEHLTLGLDEEYDNRALAEFLAYCEIMDQLDAQIHLAQSLLASLSFDSLRRELPQLTSGCNDARVPAMRIIDKMYTSTDANFNTVADMVRKDAQAVIRILYAWQENIDLEELIKI